MIHKHLKSLHKESLAYIALTRFCESIKNSSPILLNKDINFDSIFLLNVQPTVRHDDPYITYTLAEFESELNSGIGEISLVIYRKAEFKDPSGAVLRASSLVYNATNITLEDKVDLSGLNADTAKGIANLLSQG